MTTARLPRRPQRPTVPTMPKMPRGWVPPVSHGVSAMQAVHPLAGQSAGPRDWSPPGPGSLGGGGGLPGTPPERGRQGKPPKPPKIPKPPRRSPVPPRPPVVLTQRDQVIRSALAIVAILIFGFLANLTVLRRVAAHGRPSSSSPTPCASSSPRAPRRSARALSTRCFWPTAHRWASDIPSIGVHEVVRRGVGFRHHRPGPGHRRDTVLPGQAGHQRA